MKVCAILQARMTSERLPGKVLKPVLGKPLLAYELERLRRTPRVDEIVVATTVNVTDDPVAALCASMGFASFRGSEHDVLARYHGAAAAHGADVVIRVTGDCPVIDPAVVGRTLEYFLRNADRYDYVSNVQPRRYPRGLDCEVFSAKALNEAFAEADHPYEREHVTPFIHDQPKRYRIGGVANETDLSAHRWTVDTEADFELIRRILEALYPQKPDFGMEDVLELLARHPEWAEINAHVRQKPEQTVR